MKLNTKAFRYLSPDDWRVLTAVEVGSKNHEVVPTPLIVQLSALRTGQNAVQKSISTLAKADLIARVKNARYDGYRLTYGGLDYLALHAHTKSDAIVHLGSQMGVGKESDIYLVTTPASSPSSSSSATTAFQSDGGAAAQLPVEQSILKIHRLGRTSFRSLNNNRSYKGRRAHCTWHYLSRLSAQKEYNAMRALYDAGFPVPKPIAWNRHTVIMQLVPGIPLRQVPLSAFGSPKGTNDDDDDGSDRKSIERIESLYASILELALELASVGVIHGDFNEFNILVENVPDPNPDSDSNLPSQEAERKELKPWLIDFPQITSLMHPNAEFYFQRDIDCIKDFFRKRYNFTAYDAKNGKAEIGPTFQEAQSRLLSFSSNSNDFSSNPSDNRNKRARKRIDVEIEAAGFSRRMAKELSSYYDDENVKEDEEEEEEGSVEVEVIEGESQELDQGQEEDYIPEAKRMQEDEDEGETLPTTRGEELQSHPHSQQQQPPPPPFEERYSKIAAARSKPKRQQQRQQQQVPSNPKAAAGWAI